MAKTRPDLTTVAVVLERVRGAPAPRPAAGGSRRAGTVPVTIHVDPEVRVQLKVLAAERRTTVHQLVCRALNGLFAENGKPEIAR